MPHNSDCVISLVLINQESDLRSFHYLPTGANRKANKEDSDLNSHDTIKITPNKITAGVSEGDKTLYVIL